MAIKKKVVTTTPELQKKEATTDNTLVRQQWIAEAAYYLAEARNFVTGYEQEDWNTAEQKYTKEILV